MEFLVCRKIGDKSYNSADTNINCDSDFYKFNVLPINISIVVLVGFLIPLLFGIIVYR